jgi:malonyl CoA-acyl carrier protein transacylase
MFPGQGSQAKGMGAAVFDEHEEIVATADRILGYSVRELCVQDPRGELAQTEFTQPALYVVNAMFYMRRLRQSGPPDALIGHSLGELNALHAAGVYSFEAGLRLVQQRGVLMSQAAGGAMAGVIGVPAAELRQILADHGLDGIDLANFNAPDQIVISGPREELERARAILTERKASFVPLNTSGAFHSRYMRAAQEQLDGILAGVELAAPSIPVISNYTGRPYGRDDIRSNLSSQLSHPVKWREGIEYLMGLGDMTFEEVGEGRTLTNLVSKIARGGPAAPAKQSADDKVSRWNARYGVGTRVRSQVVKGPILTTKSTALVLFGHRAAVYLDGYNGYFDLDEVTVVGDL